MKMVLSEFLSRLSADGVQFYFTHAAAKEFDKLDPTIVTLYHRLIQRIANRDPRVQWAKLSRYQGSKFNTEDNCWTARANSKWRLFVSRNGNTVVILSFDHRGGHNYSNE